MLDEGWPAVGSGFPANVYGIKYFIHLSGIALVHAAGGMIDSLPPLTADPGFAASATADNVLLSPAIVSEFIASAGSQDVYVGFVERGRLEQACGPSHRAWLRFRDGEFTGANPFALRSAKVHDLLRFWEMVEKDRKSLWKLAARFGPVLLTKVLMRRLSLKSALAAAGERLGVTVQPVPLSDGRIGIDVDKRLDHALVERLLANDGRVGSNPYWTSSDSPRQAA